MAAERARKQRFRIPATLAVAAVATAGGLGALVSFGQEEQRQSNSELSIERAEQGADYFKAITELSQQPAILETASAVLEVQGTNLFEQSLNEVKTTPEFETDYKENQELIDATLLKSTQELGVYHEGDNIAITRLETDSDSAVYITQLVTEESLSLNADEWTTRFNGLSFTPPEAKAPESITELPTPITH